MSEYKRMKLSEARKAVEAGDEFLHKGLEKDDYKSQYLKAKKLTAGVNATKEEFEELGEIFDKTPEGQEKKKRYIKKAAFRIGSSGITAGSKIGNNGDLTFTQDLKQMGNRQKGIERALNREEFEELEEGKLDPAKSASTLVQHGVGADDVKKNKDGTHRFYRGFFYKSGSSSGHAKNISKGLEAYGIKHDIVDHGTQDYKPFKGGASVRSQNHHWVDVKIHPGQKIDPEKDYKAVKEEAEGRMTDTSMGGADQISASKTGEIYKKSSKQTTGPSPATGTSTRITAGKTGEAYNTTGITQRVPAVESAVLDVMAKTFERRKMFEDASNIAIISPDQRQDWLNVSTGKMDVADYFNKYKV